MLSIPWHVRPYPHDPGTRHDCPSCEAEIVPVILPVPSGPWADAPSEAVWYGQVIGVRPDLETDYVDGYSADLDGADLSDLIPAGWTVVEATMRTTPRHPDHVAHADYPHDPGTLHDCPACEAECFCANGHAPCVRCGDYMSA